MELIEYFFPSDVLFIFRLFLWFWWVWLPWISWVALESFYTDYAVGNFKRTWNWVLLEIILEKGEEKTPRSMEKTITTLHGIQSGLSWWEKKIQGKRPESFSLEIVGIDGSIHFLIRTLVKNRRLVENAVYGAFPDVEIIEVDDYTKKIDRSRLEIDYNVFGADFKLTKPDAYPIRTYMDFLDSNNDGNIDDPLTQVLESMANLEKGEQMWMQLVIEPSAPDWTDKSKKELEKLLGRGVVDNRNWYDKHIAPFAEVLTLGLMKAPAAPAEKEQKFGIAQDLTPGKADAVKAIERNMTKPGFLSTLRVVYIARNDVFSPSAVKSLLGSLKQFNDSTLNAFKPNGDTLTVVENFFAQSDKAAERMRKNIILDHYVGRKIKEARFTFNTEEVATIFHFPNGTVTTNTLRRVASKRMSPPTGLPLVDVSPVLEE